MKRGTLVKMGNVFVFSGSNRTGNSKCEYLSKYLVDRLKQYGITSSLYLASKCNLNYCVGCTRCFLGEDCLIHDDLSAIKRDLFGSDVIVFVSPVYAHNVPAPLKCLIDRLSYLLHLMPFAGNAGISISVSSNNGNKDVNSYLDTTMECMGLSVISSFGILCNDMDQVVQKSYMENAVDEIRSFLRYREIHASTYQEEVFKELSLYFSDSTDSPESKAWIRQGYHLKESFEEIVREKTRLILQKGETK